ncbi:MAG: hypothetical protein ACYC7F_03900 [Gemmatimonadaceae bacterium]
MRSSWIGAVLLVPAVLSAQAGVQGKATGAAGVSATAPDPQASAQARAHANVHAAFNAPERFSANGRAKLKAMVDDARWHGLPSEPIEHRVAEGEAKGASETAVLAAAAKVKADMEATQSVLIASGRAKPSGDECARGAMLMGRGVTSAQIETMARHTPANRSRGVAFDGVSRRAAQGVPVNQALARVQAKIDSRASDAALLSLAGGANAGLGVSANGAPAAGGAAASTQGAANAAAARGGVGVAGAVTGAVTGVVKKP